MVSRRTLQSCIATAFVAAVLATLAWGSAQEIVLHAFTVQDGKWPNGDLTFDTAGNLYGVTNIGGDYGRGVVFELTPAGGGGWNYAVLYSFQGGLDGELLAGKLAVDALGNLYGTTHGGGAYGCGTVYQLTPAAGTWNKQVLYSFTCGKDGAGPPAGAVLDGKGNLYGTTSAGGNLAACTYNPGCGTVFKLQPVSGGGWKLKVLHTFQGKTDGAYPLSGVSFGPDGNLYGTTLNAGYKGFGTVYQLSPALNGELRKFRLLYYFRGLYDGSYPVGGLIFDAAGSAYGATVAGGGGQGWPGGTVYKLIPTPAGRWKFNLLYTFTGDGMGGAENLVFDGNSNLYGTAGVGVGWGGIFELSPTQSGPWNFSVVYAFINFTDGAFPVGGVVLDANGNIFGVTQEGGAYDAGVVFEIER